jgi:hypothetical protein
MELGTTLMEPEAEILAERMQEKLHDLRRMVDF